MTKPPIPPAPGKPSGKIPLPPPRIPDSFLPPAPAKGLPKPPSRRRADLQDVAGKGPPLFIKIDKYRDVVDQLDKLKTYSLSLRDALDALADIEKELQRGITITHRALDKFNTIIASLDTKITRMPPQDVEQPELPEMAETAEYVKGLHEQMERIKRELGNLS